MSHQEPGVRRSCALPYELYIDGSLSADHSRFTIRFEAAKNRFAERAAGCPFTVYARTGNDLIVRNYAVAAGDHLEDSWSIADFPGGLYHLQVYGPHGFFREFIGETSDPSLEIRLDYTQIGAADRGLNGNVELRMVNRDEHRDFTIEIADRSYKTGTQKKPVSAADSAAVVIDTQRNYHWYDFELKIAEIPNFQRRFAGRVETGQWSFSDPAMGGIVG